MNRYQNEVDEKIKGSRYQTVRKDDVVDGVK